MTDPTPAEATPQRPVRRRPGDAPVVEGPARASAYVCEAISCLSIQSHDVLLGLGEQIAGSDITDVVIKRVGCLGLCAEGPLVQIPETGQLFSYVRADDLSGRPLGIALARGVHTGAHGASGQSHAGSGRGRRIIAENVFDHARGRTPCKHKRNCPNAQ